MNSTGFLQQMKNIYGQQIVFLLKDWLNFTKSLASMINRRIFLLQCRMKNILPNHIVNNVNCVYTLQTEDHPFKKESNILLRKFRKSVLNLEIKITIWKITQLKTKIKLIEDEVKEVLDYNSWHNFKEKVEKRFKNIFKEIKLSNVKKLNCLENKYNNVSIKYQDNQIFNYTNLEIPIEAKRILSVGPKFGIPLTKKEIPFHTIIKDIEFCISSQNLNDNEKDLIRSNAINIITNHCNSLERFDKYDRIIKDFNKTKHFLKNNDNLMVSKSDKGNSTVLIWKDEYFSHMNNMLDDEGTYKLINKDPTPKFQTEANKILKLLVDLDHITIF